MSSEKFKKSPEYALIPELDGWNQGQGISVWDWIASVGNCHHAIGFLHVFWPEFIEHGGGIFLAHDFDPTSEKQKHLWNREDLSLQDKQLIFNELDLYGLFGPAKPPTEVHARYIGERIAQMWHAKLRQDYPKFEFEFFNGDVPGLGGPPDHWIVSFCKK